MGQAAPTSGIPMMRLPNGQSSIFREDQMQDILWIGLLLGLLAVTLAYVRLCDNA